MSVFDNHHLFYKFATHKSRAAAALDPRNHCLWFLHDDQLFTLDMSLLSHNMAPKKGQQTKFRFRFSLFDAGYTIFFTFTFTYAIKDGKFIRLDDNIAEPILEIPEGRTMEEIEEAIMMLVLTE